MYDHILVALDGSEPSRCAGQAAVALAAATGARVTACHIYGAQMHRRRFSDMEPGLPAQYQEQERLSSLRTAHEKLMDEGFRALSTGYIEDFVSSSRHAGITIDSAAAEGRSYVGILHLARTQRADLIVLGADGLGAVGDGLLGGTTAKVLANAPCDVLVTRRQMGDGPILTGVDGSEAALKAAARAVALGQAMDRPIHIAAVYDPQFHTRVFVTMARSLSAQRQEEVGLANQEQLHDDIINDGLGKLYGDFLREAEHRFGGNGAVVKTTLMAGKAYHALNQQAEQLNADLIVLGRYGHHRESCSHLGSNADNLIRSTATNVLLIGGISKADTEPRIAEPAQAANHTELIKDDGLLMIEGQSASSASYHPSSIIHHQLPWSPDAESRLQRVPSFVRSMARRAVESAVREAGGGSVSAEDFDAVAARFGMGRPDAKPRRPAPEGPAGPRATLRSEAAPEGGDA